MTIPDDDLEKLARETYPIKDDDDSAVISWRLTWRYNFKAGFRAAEKMMQDRWPDEKEFYIWLVTHKTPPAYQLVYDWLKQKMFNKGEER